MATERIQLRIEDSYAGVGLKQADKAVHDFGRTCKKQLYVLSRTSEALGKQFGALGYLADNIVKGGIWGIMGTAVSKVVDLGKEAYNAFGVRALEGVKAFKKELMEASEAANKAKIASLDAQMAKAANEAAKYRKEIDGAFRRMADIHKIVDSIESERTSQAVETLLQEKARAGAGLEGADRRRSDMEFDKKISDAKFDDAIGAAEQAVKDAKAKIDAVSKSSKTLDDEINGLADADADARAEIKALGAELQKAKDDIFVRRQAIFANKGITGFSSAEKDALKELASSEEEIQKQHAANVKAIDDRRAKIAERIAAIEASRGEQAHKAEMADAELELATERLNSLMSKRQTAEAQHNAAIADLAEAEQKAAEAERKAAEAEKRRAELAEKRNAIEAKMDAVRQKNADAAAGLDRRIADTRAMAAEWEGNAKGARGMIFKDWQQEQRRKARAERDERTRWHQDSVDQNRERRIQEYARKHGWDRVSRADRDWMRQREEWKKLQDPKNNPGLKEIAKLEEEKKKLQKDTLDETKKLRDELKRLATQ